MMALIPGESVTLLYLGATIATGTIYKARKSDIVFGAPLGANHIAIMVEIVLDGSVELPVPPNKFRKLSEAIDSCVLWKRESIRKFYAPNLGENIESLPLRKDKERIDDPIGDDLKLEVGDAVDMYIDRTLVSRGVVFKLDPSDVCHG